MTISYKAPDSIFGNRTLTQVKSNAKASFTQNRPLVKEMSHKNTYFDLTYVQQIRMLARDWTLHCVNQMLGWIPFETYWRVDGYQLAPNLTALSLGSTICLPYRCILWNVSKRQKNNGLTLIMVTWEVLGAMLWSFHRQSNRASHLPEESLNRMRYKKIENERYWERGIFGWEPWKLAEAISLAYNRLNSVGIAAGKSTYMREYLR